MRTPILATAIVAALLAGCGGGGSTSSPFPGGQSSGSSPSSLTQQDVAQSATTAAFEPIDSGEADAGVANGSLGTTASSRSPQSAGFTCRHRRSRTVTVNADGSVTVETKDYYDNACTQLERDAVAVFASSGGTATVNRTVTTFNQAHLQLGVRKAAYSLTGSTSNGSWVVTSAFYPGTSATPLSQFGHSATLNASAYAATTGRIINDAKPSVNASFGHQAATNATVATDGNNVTTYTGTRNGALFKGALGALTLSASPPFTISGGSQLGTSALTGSVAFNADGTLVNVSLTGTLINGNQIAVTSTTDANGILTVNGTITSATGAPVATFSTDAHGNGILTLAGGTQVPIVDWHVIWG